MSDKRKISWTIWGTAALLLMVIVYPLSLGPAVAFLSSSYAESLIEATGPIGESALGLAIGITYWPLEQLAMTFPDSIGTVLQGYVDWWTPNVFVVPPGSAPVPASPGPPMIPVESL